jgi:hypothetical protein
MDVRYVITTMSKGARRALLDFGLIDPVIRERLIALGLITKTFGDYAPKKWDLQYTKLGLAVRKALMEMNDG